MSLHGNGLTCFTGRLSTYYAKMSNRPLYRLAIILLGLPTFLFMLVKFVSVRHSDDAARARKEIRRELEAAGAFAKIHAAALRSERRKAEHFGRKLSEAQLAANAERHGAAQTGAMLDARVEARLREQGLVRHSVFLQFDGVLRSPALFILSLITSLPMYILILIYSSPYSKYI